MQNKSRLSETFRYLGMGWFLLGPIISIRLSVYFFPKLSLSTSVLEFLSGVAGSFDSSSSVLGLGVLLYMSVLIVLIIPFFFFYNKKDTSAP